MKWYRLAAEQGGAVLVKTNNVEKGPDDVKKLAAKFIAKQATDLDKVVAFVEEGGVTKACRIDSLVTNTSVVGIPGKKALFDAQKGKAIGSFGMFMESGKGKINLGHLADQLEGKTPC